MPGGRRTPVGDAIIALIKQYPKAPAKQLARMALDQHPQLFRDVEDARDRVRYYLGLRGKTHRKHSDKTLHREPRKPGQWEDVIPDALTQLPDWKAECIPGANRVLVLSDVHIPFHDREALQVALDFGLKRKPTLILLNGDIADHYAQSEYSKDPRHRDFPGEVLMVKKFLSGIRKQFGKACRIIYKLGNHEERYDRYLRHRAPELLGVEDFKWQNVFGLEANKVQLVKENRPIRLGKLNILHGHEYKFNISNPVNPARGLFLRGKTHALCGHFHQSSNHSEKNLDGLVVSTWSTGALCDLHPEYRPLNQWNSGFAWVEVSKDDAFHVENLRIIGGKCY